MNETELRLRVSEHIYYILLNDMFQAKKDQDYDSLRKSIEIATDSFERREAICKFAFEKIKVLLSGIENQEAFEDTLFVECERAIY